MICFTVDVSHTVCKRYINASNAHKPNAHDFFASLPSFCLPYVLLAPHCLWRFDHSTLRNEIKSDIDPFIGSIDNALTFVLDSSI